MYPMTATRQPAYWHPGTPLHVPAHVWIWLRFEKQSGGLLNKPAFIPYTATSGNLPAPLHSVPATPTNSKLTLWP